MGEDNSSNTRDQIMRKPALLVLTAFALASPGMALITYVDATTNGVTQGNTAVAPSYGGGPFSPFVGQSGVANDGVWDLRAFGNGATIFQNAQFGQVDTNAVRLATTVSGLALDTYYVYAYFWSDSSSWRMGASLSDDPGQLPLYQRNPNSPGTTQWYTGGDGTVLSTALAFNPFTTPVMVAEGNRRLMQINLGTVTGTGFTVYIDPDRNQVDANARTWYDGVGYSTELIPEPTTFGLLSLGGLLLLLAWRRNRRS
jgi:hypothetical protein